MNEQVKIQNGDILSIRLFGNGSFNQVVERIGFVGNGLVFWTFDNFLTYERYKLERYEGARFAYKKEHENYLEYFDAGNNKFKMFRKKMNQ